MQYFIIFTSSPLLIFISIIVILIKLFKNEDILYCDYRIGYKCKKFKVFKFLTIKSINKNLFLSNKEKNLNLSKFNQFLRNYRIDEIPQIINILKLDMNLIGPRPESLKVFRSYKNKNSKNLYFDHKPGIFSPGSLYLLKNQNNRDYSYKKYFIKKTTIDQNFFNNVRSFLDNFLLVFNCFKYILIKK